MTATYLGSLTVGGAMPGAAALAAAGAAGINAALPDLLERLENLLAFTPQPIDLTTQLANAQAIVTGIQATITLGLPAPSIATQLAALAALIASLQAQISGIQAQLAVVVGFQGLLGAAGLHAIAFDGHVGDFGAEVSAQLASVPISPIDPAHAVTLITTSPAAWAALSQLLRVNP
jgi:hypothetical protein